MNEITAWIDASNVYGSDSRRARALRRMDGSGKLKTSAGGFLPFNSKGLHNAGGSDATLFLAGDIRANEQLGLTALHTLFVREHNRLVDRLSQRFPRWRGERLHQKARQVVGAQMQVITYREFLPALLGPDALPPYRGYRPATDASIGNAFSTAAFRFGHSALSRSIRRINAAGNTIHAGDVALREAFFAPWRLISEGGLEPVLRGLAAQRCQTIDTIVIEDVRSFLFGAPGAGGFDLAALNIQRGRDHGLPSYNNARRLLQLEPASSFGDISEHQGRQRQLARAYRDVEKIDLWVGGLAEDPVPGSHLGPLFHAIVSEQFIALRDGDRFWFQRTLDPLTRHHVENTTLADIIRRNTAIGAELADDVFRAAGQPSR